MTLLLEPLHKDCLYSLQPPKPAESQAADSVLTVLMGGCTCGGEEMEQLRLINSNPDSCNPLLCLLMGHSREHMCIQKFPGNYSLEVATIWLWRSRGNKKCFKTQEPCREPAGNWAVKSHNMLFTTRQSNRTFVFHYR